jgi:hypothetical protein
MFRQRALPILLAFFLLLFQQLGMVHAVSHLSPDLSSSTSNDKHLPGKVQCDLCLAFSAIGSALPGTPPALFADLPASKLVVAVPIVSFLSFPTRAFDSRGPPVSFL